jgi:hypothetical protein
MRLMTVKWCQKGRAEILVRRIAATQWMVVKILIDVVEGGMELGEN